MGDVISYPECLQDYDGLLVLSLPRLAPSVAAELDNYRDDGGGLFIAGVTGVMDDYGRPNTTALNMLLGVTVTAMIADEAQIDEWVFDAVEDSLVGSLSGTVTTDNLYYIPVLPHSSGFTEVAHLTGDLPAPVVGYKGKTVFWFPRLTLGNDLLQIQFQRNLWTFFDVAPNAVAPAPVEAVGGN